MEGLVPRLLSGVLFGFSFLDAFAAGKISISATQNLSFGKLAAGTGGTVVVDPAGVRTKTGNVTLLSSGPATASQFSITGSPNGTYGITLPTSATMTSGAFSMTVDTFVSIPAGTGTVTSVASILTVGATLHAASSQQAGGYSGTFTVTVNHN